jgi:uncharacterized membrane protein YwzB
MGTLKCSLKFQEAKVVKVAKEDKADQAKVVLILTTMMTTTSSTEIMIAIALNCHLSSKFLNTKLGLIYLANDQNNSQSHQVRSHALQRMKRVIG